jgi:cell division protein FtsL
MSTANINPDTPGAPSPVNHYIQTSTNVLTAVDYKVGDFVHVYETNRWRDYDSTFATAFMGYITTPPTGNSILTVVSNTGPIGPGLIQSLNNVLPDTFITELLTGVGTAFLGEGSTWRLNQRYTSSLGSSNAAIQMYMFPRSSLRWFTGNIKEIYPDPVFAGYYYVTFNMLDTNEEADQLKWSVSSSNYSSQNAQGQVAECLSISLDQDNTVLPNGDAITPSTWNQFYDFDVNEGIAYETLYSEEKFVTSSSSSLIVIIIIIVLVLIIFVALLKIWQKKKTIDKMDMDDMDYKETSSDSMHRVFSETPNTNTETSNGNNSVE